MNKIKITLDTQKDVGEFVHISSTIEDAVYLEDGTGFKVNAKSLMGVLYGTAEFKDLYVISDSDIILNKFDKFMA